MGESFAINVSSKLVNQLANDADKLRKKTKKPKPKIALRSPQPRTLPHQEAPSTGWPLQPPLFLPVSPPPTVANAELDAIRSALQESESILERLQKQEANMVHEVTQRAKDSLKCAHVVKLFADCARVDSPQRFSTFSNTWTVDSPLCKTCTFPVNRRTAFTLFARISSKRR